MPVASVQSYRSTSKDEAACSSALLGCLDRPRIMCGTPSGRLFMKKNPPPSPDGAFEVASSIPVLKMNDEAKAKAFYLDFLGYEIDWEHRFEPSNPDSPLYMPCWAYEHPEDRVGRVLQ